MDGAQVETVTVKNRQLADSVTLVSNEANKVFLAIGTKDSLRKEGVIVQEGKKFLVFGGKQTVPARELNPAAFRVLDARTEGWIAALQLAALSMQGRDDVASFIAGFAGDEQLREWVERSVEFARTLPHK